MRNPVSLQLSGDFLARRGESLNITVSLSKNVTGQVYLYAGGNYLGMEMLTFSSVNGISKTL